MAEDLVKLIQLGGLGAGIAFLILSYRLLKQAIEQRDESLLVFMTILVFMAGSFAFFATGFVVEVVFRASPEFQQKFVDAVVRRISPLPYIRKAFLQVAYNFDAKTLEYSIADTPIDAGSYLTDLGDPKHKFVVALRASANLPANHGTYIVTNGPFDLADHPIVNIPKDKVAYLQEKCLDAAIFEVPADVIEFPIDQFNPDDYVAKGIRLLDFRHMCAD